MHDSTQLLYDSEIQELEVLILEIIEILNSFILTANQDQQ